MSKVLLDTNIILDIALERDGFVKKSIELLLLLNKQEHIPVVTATTVTDIYYISKKQVGHDTTISFLINLFEHIKIAGVETTIVINALKSRIKDFEDAIQIEAAKHNDINTLITRNKKDFINSDLEVFTPEEYIDKWKNI